MTKVNLVALQEIDLDNVNGGFSWGASNPTTARFTDVMVESVKNGQPTGIVIANGGNGFSLPELRG